MLALLRRPLVWLILLGLISAGGVAAFLSAQDKAHKTASAAAAKPVDTPYAAIAAGKIDVEGGVIQVAARTAGVVREVDVQEGDSVTKGQVLARLEDDQLKLAADQADIDGWLRLVRAYTVLNERDKAQAAAAAARRALAVASS